MSALKAPHQDEIVVADFPALQDLCWSYHLPTISPLDALHKYEDGWFRVNTKKLAEKERALIARLTQTVGNGCFLG